MFAYFEFIIAQIAVVFDNSIVTISETPVFNNNILIIQRVSVIVTDVMLFIAVLRYF